MRLLHLILMTSIVMIGSSFNLIAQQDQTIYDEDVKSVGEAAIDYPPLAKMARIRGIVVVKVTLDHKGRVVAASAITGHPLLSRACLPNANEWKFQPSHQKGAIIIYEFRLGESFCPNGSNNVIRPPNVLVVTGCIDPVEP